MSPADRAGREAAGPGRCPARTPRRSMPSSSSFSSSSFGRDAVEEQVDREDDDDEVVEPADDRDVVRDEVAPEDEVAERAAEQRLAGRRRPLVADQRPDEPGVDRAPGWRAAGSATEHRQRRPIASTADRPPSRVAHVDPRSPTRARRAHSGTSDRRTSGPSGVHRRARRAAIREIAGTGPVDPRLDIERPFGMMRGTRRRRVTRHDAERKVKILDYIAATLRARGFPPSVREIARAVGLASTSAVHHHLQILEREGYLERGAAQSRAIRLTPTAAIRLGPRERARAAVRHAASRTSCRSSARSPPAVRSRRTRTPRRPWRSRSCSPRAATPTS